MIFLYALLALILVSVFTGTFIVVKRLRKKEPIRGFSIYAPALINLGIGFFFALLVALILSLVTGGIGGFNGLVYFSTIIALPVLLKPSRLLLKTPDGEPVKANKRKIVFTSLLAFGLLFDLTVINQKSFFNYGDVSTVQSTSFSSVTKAMQNDNGLDLMAGAEFVVEAPGHGATSLRLDFVPRDNVSMSVTVYANTSTVSYGLGSFAMDGKNVDFHMISVPDIASNKQQVSSYKLVFKFADDHYLQGQPTGVPYITVSSVTFNAKPRVYFSILRFAVYAGIVGLCCYAPKIMDVLRKKHEVTKGSYLLIAGFGVASLAIAVVAVLINRESLFMRYPIPDETLAKMDTDIFCHLFDAFRKGQVHIDVKPDPKLVALANPYDPGTRRGSGATYLWDHAFYNNLYYCYYGAVPVILVSFPLYFLTGMTYVPNAFCLEIIGMAMLIPAFLLLIFEVYRFVRKQVSWSGFVLLGASGLVTSMMIMAITFKDGYYHESIYHVPDIYGLLFFDLFLFFLLRAYRRKQGRLVELLFTGLFIVLVIGSRPNLIIPMLISVPLLIAMFLDKQFTWKQRFKQFGPMLGVLAVGAFLICWYNKARFDSIFEFGQSYQITVADQRTLTYAPDKFLPSVIHFFFQGTTFYNRFPYISCVLLRLSFDNCPYVQSYFGTCLVPLFCGVFFLPVLFHRDRWEIRTMAWAFPIAMVFFAFTTYSKAGVCPRYMIEPYHILTIAGFMAILKLADRTEKTTAYQPVIITVSAIVLFSAFECLCLSFDIFDGMNVGDANGFYLICKSIFGGFNI